MSPKDPPDGIVIQVRVTPGSSRNAITREESGRITVRLTAPPVEGKANKELLKLLGKKLKVPPSSITILKGHASREKTLLIPGLDEAGLAERLRN